jgi:hypothetical protein
MSPMAKARHDRLGRRKSAPREEDAFALTAVRAGVVAATSGAAKWKRPSERRMLRLFVAEDVWIWPPDHRVSAISANPDTRI